MHKTLILVAAATIAGIAMADGNARSVSTLQEELTALPTAAAKVEYKKGITTAEWRSICDAMLANSQTNKKDMAKINNDFGVFYAVGSEWSQYSNAVALAGEYDAKFAAAGIRSVPLFYKGLPQTCENYLTSTNREDQWFVQSHPLLVAAMRKNKSGNVTGGRAASFGDCINLYAESLAAYNTNGWKYGWYNGDASSIKDTIIKQAPKAVKAAMRKKGMSFVVTEDGMNPVQEAVNALVIALDAPKLQGLGAWVGEWIPGYVWTEPTWMDANAINAYKEKIFMGEEDFTEYDKSHLCAYLGVNEYNNFVREYNGE